MRSRCMSLLPRNTLHSDSKQFIYNWLLEDDLDLDWGNWRKLNGREEKWTKVVERIHATIIGNCLCPGSRVGSRSSRKRHRKQRKKGVMQTKLWCGFTQTIPGSHAESRFGRKETREKKGIMQTTSWCGFTQTIPGSHVESRFDRKETRDKKDVMQTGRI